MYIMLKVASRSGMPTTTIRKLLITPTKTPTRSGSSSTSHNGISYQTIKEAVTTVDSDIVEPTDRSKPSTTSVNVTPSANSVTMEIERRISVKLPYVKKASLMVLKYKMIKASKAIAPYLNRNWMAFSFAELPVFGRLFFSTACI